MEEISNIKKDSYIDKYGLVHSDRGAISENGPTFTAVLYVLEAMRGRVYNDIPFLRNVYDREWDLYYADPSTMGMHFSHDNMTGVYVCTMINGGDMTSLPVLKWNRRWWLHPRDVIFYLSMKGYKLALIAACLLFPFMMFFSYKKPPSITSGKQLWFLRLFGLVLNPLVPPIFTRFLLRASHRIIKTLYPEYSVGVFRFYYDAIHYYYTCNGRATQEDHPIIESFKEVLFNLYGVKV